MSAGTGGLRQREFRERGGHANAEYGTESSDNIGL
jgi:hypothetical protein